MRPQQQNRRMRGRGNNNNNNNRKGPNPLTRSYESNGPDVKIRGTAQQIADKYTTLARDAQSSGDRVMAENYLQHAEHYNRIIAAAQAQQQQQQQQSREGHDADDDVDERDDYDVAANSGHRERQKVNDGSGPQPVIEGTPAEIALNQREAAANGANGHDMPQVNGSEPVEKPAAAEEAQPAQGSEEPAPRRARRPRRTTTTRRTKEDDTEKAAESGAEGDSAPSHAEATAQ